ncbi:MAG: hypothetical protein PHV37_10100 [Candidatus Gastranaerophilales bacterium]|nr:hypothetical protein [Candidatus Gastranaerophilales bacterium]
MLSFLFKKATPDKCKEINAQYKKLKDLYDYNSISDDRKTYLKDTIEKFGYLPYPHIKALEELSPAEVLYGLEVKWNLNNIFENNSFNFTNEEISPVSRANINNSDWIKREQHNIKLVNLAALGDGNKTHEVGKFIDWLRQILILPSGSIDNSVLATTMYLIPFHPREFGCAYLPTSSSVSPNLEDKDIKSTLDLDAKAQVQLFISIAQLAGHPVIYDVLPQTGRYSKLVLSNPQIARWFDVNQLIESISKEADKIAFDLNNDYDPEDVEIVKTIYKNALKNGSDDVGEFYKEIYRKMNDSLLEKKKMLSTKMLSKAEQIKLHKRAKDIIANAHGVKPNKIATESDITNQGQAIQDLIKEGLWPAPGGAWCSSGIPIFDKMADCGSFPSFLHFNYLDENVTHFANLDCQTPYYFVFLENGEYNHPVIDFYINKLKELQEDYNFDGIRVDHIDHVVDEVSEKAGVPISYRAPRIVLGKANKALKEKKPHFAVLAEYMLGGHYYKEYHEEMAFDILWGNDIIAQCEKNPNKIIEDNQDLEEFNAENVKKPKLSILKTYNNQDGEFRAIDQYPGQLSAEGALFKWFKIKFIPGGKSAERPAMYVDGDESFTRIGIESTIGSEISLPRAKNYEFYEKFDAINRFALNCDLTRDGEAQIITQEDEGFVSWMINKDPSKETLLIVANYQPPTEKISHQLEDGSMECSIKEGESVYNKSIQVPGDYTIKTEIVYNPEQKDFIEQDIATENNTLYFEELKPSEYKIFKLLR